MPGREGLISDTFFSAPFVGKANSIFPVKITRIIVIAIVTAEEYIEGRIRLRGMHHASAATGRGRVGGIFREYTGGGKGAA